MSCEFIPAAKSIIEQEECDAADVTLTSGAVAQGPQVKVFEEGFSAQVADGAHCTTVSSDTLTRYVAILASKFRERTGGIPEVITLSFTFAVTGNLVAINGVVSVFVNIDPVTFTLDPASVETSIIERATVTKTIHLYGLPANMPEIPAIAGCHGLVIFEDCAQVHGAVVEGKPVDAFGAWGSLSSYPTKNIIGFEGGTVTTADAKLARCCCLIRNQGAEQQYTNGLVGLNDRVMDVATAVGRIQPARPAGWTAARQANVACLNELPAGVEGVVASFVPENYTHVYHQHTIRLEGATGAERDAVQAVLCEERQVGGDIHCPTLNHHLALLIHYAEGLGLSGIEKAACECPSLLIYPFLSEVDLECTNQVVAATARVDT